MRRGQPTVLFAFTVLVGVARVFAYAGTPIGGDLSSAALAEFIALQVFTFAFATFLVATLSRATASRAAQVALYAQGLLFLAPFVDIGLGLPLASYEDTFVGIVGSPGAALGNLAYAAVLAWGVWDASVGGRRARDLNAIVAAIAAFAGLSLLAVPWPRPLVLTFVAWGVRLALALYYGLLACVFLALAIRAAMPSLFRQIVRRADAAYLVAFALLPFLGIVTAGVLSVPLNAEEPVLRLQLEAPYMIAAGCIGALLWMQWRLVRLEGWDPFRIEAARVLKVAVLGVAFLLGWSTFLVALAAASLVWLDRDAAHAAVLGAMAALAVLVGDMTVVAVNFADWNAGPVTFTVSADPWGIPSSLGIVAALALGALVTWAARPTSRTSA